MPAAARAGAVAALLVAADSTAVVDDLPLQVSAAEEQRHIDETGGVDAATALRESPRIVLYEPAQLRRDVFASSSDASSSEKRLFAGQLQVTVVEVRSTRRPSERKLGSNDDDDTSSSDSTSSTSSTSSVDSSGSSGVSSDDQKSAPRRKSMSDGTSSDDEGAQDVVRQEPRRKQKKSKKRVKVMLVNDQGKVSGKQKTHWSARSRLPVLFDTVFNFDVKPEHSALRVLVRRRKRLRKHFLGEARVPLAFFVARGTVDGWFALEPPANKPHKKARGAVRLAVRAKKLLPQQK